ncbi:uncharacterized protein LOC133784283 [Humulus lupulus]|uniref:uncharacterized protein LOC133784283 n=1 Tax=Humulus lupulus TaxID=3486 RepID=UPI002B41050A|nr:uncharacterized protein LOC133784283 [Humulus lupulus]
MYPRVKVRAQEDCFSPQIDSKPTTTAQQEKENQNSDSPLLPIARILKAYVLNSTMELNSASKVEKKRPVVKDSKPNLGASSVPRPRAVLSSPDNDGLIGSRNKLLKERSSALKMKMHSKGEEKVGGGVGRIKTIPIEEGLKSKTCSDEGLKSKTCTDQKQKKMKKQGKLQQEQEEEEHVVRTSQKKRILRVGKGK